MATNLRRFLYRFDFNKGFTLVELVVTAAIFVILLSLFVYFLGYFQINRNLDIQRQNLTRILRLAQTKAQSGLDNSAFGLRLEANRYILFKGSSYSGRDVGYDLISLLPNNITISGMTEIIFLKITGQPSQTGNILLTESRTNFTRMISINSQGLIQEK